ncbi:CHC2 zinc finger domain-containing protein [Chitinophaga sp. Hz27]|uniref:CHC2 zinc finger domain-containing protein n=1 Tax=Chitinophaga sp. Hz27 TaxID=3347169 RepID=UPI0035D700D2
MEITEIKQQLTLATILHHYGLKPDKSLRLHCPFHDDKTPSLQVYYKTHTAYCFSANCKTHGKPLDVIAAKTYIQSRGLNNEVLEIGHNSGQFIHGARREIQPLRSSAKITRPL